MFGGLRSPSRASFQTIKLHRFGWTSPHFEKPRSLRRRDSPCQEIRQPAGPSPLNRQPDAVRSLSPPCPRSTLRKARRSPGLIQEHTKAQHRTISADCNLLATFPTLIRLALYDDDLEPALSLPSMATPFDLMIPLTPHFLVATSQPLRTSSWSLSDEKGESIL